MSKVELVKFFEESFKKNWDKVALRNQTTSLELTYGAFAKEIATYHVFFKSIGIEEGDAIAVSGKNSIRWSVAYMSVMTYGAVVVPILDEFHPRDITHIINHSSAKLLFCDSDIWKKMNGNDFDALQGVISLSDETLLKSASTSVEKNFKKREKMFKAHYKEGFTAESISYTPRDENELAVLCYTSGTTSMTKGVMLSYLNIWANVDYARRIFGDAGVKLKSTLCVLPLAHTYGTTFTFLLQLQAGATITILGRMPTPVFLIDACKAVKPTLLLLVPLVLEKIYKSKILPIISKKSVKRLLEMPVIGSLIYRAIGKKIYNTLGGALYEVILGGAAMDKDVEAFFIKAKFPFMSGYGMTECGPLISYIAHDKFVQGSVGKVLDTLDIRIDNPDEETSVGEIQVKCSNVLLGYYKNEEATAETFTEDGWLRTGDLGTIDSEGNIYIKGRCKTMLLSSSGENVYPEPIEAKLSNLPFVSEAIVFEQEKSIVAWVYPDMEAVKSADIDDDGLQDIMRSNLKTLNSALAKFEAVHAIKISPEPFPKTPKQTVKRAAAQEMIENYLNTTK